MAAIRYAVPYEINVFAKDNASGRAISNKHYYICGQQLVNPPPFGSAIAGSGSTTTALNNFGILYQASIVLGLNHNYTMISYVMQAILGKRYSSPLFPIQGVAVGTPTTLTTASPHGLITGQQIVIYGVTSPAVVNAVWVVDVIGPYSFSLRGSSLQGPWSGDGMMQKVQGSWEFLYADKETSIANLQPGLIVGDALPLFCTGSVRRLNAGIGRAFRSRFSLSPMSESDSIDGGFTSTVLIAWSGRLNNFRAGFANGGTDSGSGLMVPVALSHKAAFAQPSPFTSNTAFTAAITGYRLQQNTGSLVRRKPKLTSTIS